MGRRFRGKSVIFVSYLHPINSHQILWKMLSKCYVKVSPNVIKSSHRLSWDAIATFHDDYRSKAHRIILRNIHQLCAECSPNFVRNLHWISWDDKSNSVNNSPQIPLFYRGNSHLIFQILRIIFQILYLIQVTSVSNSHWISWHVLTKFRKKFVSIFERIILDKFREES